MCSWTAAVSKFCYCVLTWEPHRWLCTLIIKPAPSSLSFYELQPKKREMDPELGEVTEEEEAQAQADGATCCRGGTGGRVQQTASARGDGYLQLQ